MVTSYCSEVGAAGVGDSGRFCSTSGEDSAEASLATIVSGGSESEGTAAAASVPVLSLSTSEAAHRTLPKLELLLNVAPRANCVAIAVLKRRWLCEDTPTTLREVAAGQDLHADAAVSFLQQDNKRAFCRRRTVRPAPTRDVCMTEFRESLCLQKGCRDLSAKCVPDKNGFLVHAGE